MIRAIQNKSYPLCETVSSTADSLVDPNPITIQNIAAVGSINKPPSNQKPMSKTIALARQAV
jgi:hypothetical protein